MLHLTIEGFIHRWDVGCFVSGSTALGLGHLTFLTDQSLYSGKLSPESTCEGSCSFALSSFQGKQKLIYAFMQLCLRKVLVVLVQGSNHYHETFMRS